MPGQTRRLGPTPAWRTSCHWWVQSQAWSTGSVPPPPESQPHRCPLPQPPPLRRPVAKPS
eukprot:8018201-Lingulodinium_polyedra.AAC.1